MVENSNDDSIVSVNTANGTTGNVSKAALTNTTKVGGGVLSNVSKAIGGSLKELGRLLSESKK